MIILKYETKAELRSSIGEFLNYEAVYPFNDGYTSNGDVLGSNRPALTGALEEFHAIITMEDGKIKSVK